MPNIVNVRPKNQGNVLPRSTKVIVFGFLKLGSNVVQPKFLW